MAEPMRYPEMAAAMPDVTGRALLHALLGCRWGHVVSTPDDMTPCTDQAVRIIVLHDGPVTLDLKLCARHVARLEQETTPRPQP